MRYAFLALVSQSLVVWPAYAADEPLYEYVRSNHDGSEAETILVYRPTPETVEVVKMRQRCTNAAYVTATVSRATRSAVRLVAGRLLPEAKRETFGEMSHDPVRGELVMRIAMNGETHAEQMPIGAGPWHLYDFDLASLSAVLDGQRADRRSIHLRLPLAWNGGPPVLRDLGDVTLTFVRSETFAGRAAYRYEARGSSPSFKGGPLWRDANEGFILGADWGTPNHGEYQDFQLRLKTSHSGGAAQWKALLEAHFIGCERRDERRR